MQKRDQVKKRNSMTALLYGIFSGITGSAKAPVFSAPLIQSNQTSQFKGKRSRRRRVAKNKAKGLIHDDKFGWIEKADGHRRN